jgi:hypothetical protein
MNSFCSHFKVIILPERKPIRILGILYHPVLLMETEYIVMSPGLSRFQCLSYKGRNKKAIGLELEAMLMLISSGEGPLISYYIGLNSCSGEEIYE